MGGILKEIYTDLASPATQSLGIAFQKIIDIVLEPSGRCCDILKENLLKFVNKLGKEKRENIIPADPVIAIPIWNKLTYVEEEILVDRYTELLKNNSLKDTQTKVLPAYCDMLSRLTADEIKILDYLKNSKYLAKVPGHALDLSFPENFPERLQDTFKKSLLDYPIHGVPFLEVRYQDKVREKGFITQKRYLNDIPNRISLTNPSNIEIYFENLKATGIFLIQNNAWFLPLEIYTPLEERARAEFNQESEEIQKNILLELRKGRMDLTPLGESFLNVCSPDLSKVQVTENK